jgi:hypothetical protein
MYFYSMKQFFKQWLAPLCLLFIIAACEKERFTNSSSALLRTSTDTLHFDTVFTTTGSITQSLKIFNDNKEGIRISSVRLSGGALSPYKINVNGYKGPVVNDLEIAGKDSAYIFVTVSINPTASNLPFFVRDSIEINYNGNRKFVQLDALGQNAHFLRNKIVSGTETWNNDLPYIILGRLTVEENATLIINKGTRIYMHSDAPFVVNGTLQVRGDKGDGEQVLFTGDRLDEPYRDYPGSFPGLIFSTTSKNNSIAYGVIRNAYQGVTVVDPAHTANPKLVLEQTIIDNAYDAGLLAVNSSVRAQNVLISNCGKNMVLTNGGNYQFTHCTAASYSSTLLQRKEPLLSVSNYLNATTPPADLNAVFRNCIFWGEGAGLLKEEVVVTKNGATAFNVVFDHVLWQLTSNPANSTVTNAIANQRPLFDSVNTSNRKYDFRLQAESPALNKGTATAVTVDLDGKPRPVGAPDLGAYEKQP